LLGRLAVRIQFENWEEDSMTIPCPECDHTDYHGKVEKEVHQRFGGTLEPVGEWVDCDYCDGSGEVEEEDDG
jgi:hypothetical protein